VADRCGQRDQRGGLRLGGHRARPVGGRPDDSVPALADLLVFLGSVLFLEIAGTSIYFGLSRPRPYGVTIIGSWGGYSGVSPPVAVVTIFLMGIVYCLAVPGRARSRAKAAVAVVVAVFCLARLYLAAIRTATSVAARESVLGPSLLTFRARARRTRNGSKS
jgi:hypothetical protein